jgi:hypothetical protein
MGINSKARQPSDRARNVAMVACAGFPRMTILPPHRPGTPVVTSLWQLYIAVIKCLGLLAKPIHNLLRTVRFSPRDYPA